MGKLNIQPMNHGQGDMNSYPILRRTGTPKTLTTSTSSGNVVLPTGGKWLRFVASVNMAIKFGADNTVVATDQDFWLAAGVPEYIPADTDRNVYVAAIEV